MKWRLLVSGSGFKGVSQNKKAHCLISIREGQGYSIFCSQASAVVGLGTMLSSPSWLHACLRILHALSQFPDSIGPSWQDLLQPPKQEDRNNVNILVAGTQRECT